MRKSTRNNIADARMLTLEQACVVVGMGKNRTREYCDKIHATRKFSPRMVRFDRTVIDQALDEMAAQAAGDAETA